MGILKKLWKGELSLLLTFWIFGVAINILFRLMFYYINQNYIEFTSRFGNYSLYFLSAISLIYSFFIWVAIWRSADKFEGWQVLAAIAKLMVILAVLHTFLDYDKGILSQLFNQKSTDQQLKDEIKNLNKGLPTKLDKNTELYKITWDKNSISYYFRLIDLNAEQYTNLKNNFKNVQQTFTTGIRNKACKNNDIKKFLALNIELYYRYKIEENEILNIRVTKDDCK